MRTSCLTVFALALCAGRLAAQCSAAPPAFSTTCTELEGYLTSFASTLSTEWDGAPSPVAFSTELLAADANRGLKVLLDPSTFDAVVTELNALDLVGLQSVTVAVGFPILYQPFYQYNNDPQDYTQVLSLYQNVIAELRRRGLRVVIETSVLFPSHATDLPLSAYYATLSADQITAGRAVVAQTIAQQLQPDWLNLGSEPDTQSALLGLSAEYTPQEYAAEISTIVTQLRGAGINGKPLLGAGCGAWQMNAGEYIQALGGTGIDYVDFHIYSVNLGLLALAPGYIDMAHAAGKGAAISEIGLKKITDADLQGKTEYGIIQALSDSTTTAEQAYSFWAPLDAQFITEVGDLAYWKNLYYISPFAGQYFFAYVDYSQAGGLDAQQLDVVSISAADAAVAQGTLSSTGEAYAALIGGERPTAVSSASGTAPVAANSLLSIYGTSLAASATLAPSNVLPLPTKLGEVSGTITDSARTQAALPLFYAGPTQINALVPSSLAPGAAQLVIATPSGNVTQTMMLAALAPGLFSANQNGQGVAAAQVVTNQASGTQSVNYVFDCSAGAGKCAAAPIDLSAGPSALVLYGTGIRGVASAAGVTVQVGSMSLPALYAGAAPGYVGLDQVNVALPASLAGSGVANVRVFVSGIGSNVVTVSFR